DGIAKTLAYSAIQHKKHLITANKALIAKHGYDLHKSILDTNISIYYEAAVAGAIPIIDSVKNGLVSNNILGIEAILNGTCNYIMSDMTNNETSFQESLRKAQELGFAEADPAFDIEGIDSGHKLVILGMLAYGVKPDLDKVFIEGITSITSEDIKYATRLGFVIKLLCIARQEKNKLDFRVHPSLIPLNTLPASINGALNAVFIQGDYSDKITFIGEGAGANPTASSVVSDIINAARNHKLKNNLSFLNQKLEYKDIIDRVGRYYIRFVVQDVAGVLANITTILNNKHISLDSVVQDRNKGENFNNIIVLTHETKELDIKNAINDIDSLDTVLMNPNLIRVENL
ncbi:homoserine dehydrogenase, partial [Alphaproteobacteria bacterium]|nr:homoserine dehydrogenase [Alphaproteobacteria bacterium]